MAKKRRKRGAFDPDYRRKGWNKSTFAPKNSNLTMTGFAFGIPFVVWVLLANLSSTRSFIQTNWMLTCGGAVVIGFIIFIITRIITWRMTQ